MHGSINDIRNNLDQLKNFNSDIENDIDYMTNLANLVVAEHTNVQINYDFCELQGFDYENDIIFSAYIENDSEEVALGGKYNCSENNTSGIGFSVDVRYLLKNQPVEKKLINKLGKWIIESNNE